MASGDSFIEALVPSSTVADYASAAIGGMLTVSSIGKVASVAANAALSGITYLADCDIYNEDPSVLEFGLAVANGALSGLIGGSGMDLQTQFEITQTAKQVLDTAVSPKKIALYGTKIAAIERSMYRNTFRYFLSTFSSTMINQTKDKISYLLD